MSAERGGDFVVPVSRAEKRTAHGVVFTQDSKNILVQFDVERALALYTIRDGKLVDTGERVKLAAGPVSIRSMPR